MDRASIELVLTVMDAKFRHMAFDLLEQGRGEANDDDLPVEMEIQTSDGDLVTTVWSFTLKPDYPLDPSLAALEKLHAIQEWKGCYVPIYNGPVANLPIKLPSEYNPSVHQLLEPEDEQ